MSSVAAFQDLTDHLPDWVEAYRAYAAEGRVATYIPELAHAPQQALGITLHHKSGAVISAGDAGMPFTLQSISKVFTLLLALMDRGEKAVFEKVGMEPTGDVFNSMLKLELVQPGKPFNPLINAGAIVISSLIRGDSPEHKAERIVRFIRELAGDEGPSINEHVYRSEAETANRNRSLAYFLKDNKVLDEEVEPTLDVYFRQCAIEVTCAQVARMGLVLANDGADPFTGRELVPKRYVRIAKSFMVTCGMYNASGEFAIQVGIPAKSGVAGGILALVPGELGIGIIGPALNDKGNSTAGVHLLRLLSERYDWSMF
ncbi:MAG: glutaminase [Paenibacillus sp.]|jgi:glutaminase|uniref:glutaminase A n=1 Tax=Paenibacillus sp. GCM10012303 TaxID=3317340 RepID=UPI0029E9067A|nr:glutaminase [Paenibacillus sp.]